MGAAGKLMTTLIGILLIVTGLIMKMAPTFLEGSFLAHRYGWTHTVMTGNTVVFFGLVFIGFRVYLAVKGR